MSHGMTPSGARGEYAHYSKSASSEDVGGVEFYA